MILTQPPSTGAGAGSARPAGLAPLLWRITGILLVALGFVGMVLPLLPTTIFWILAAICFGRSDPRLQAWLFRHPRFGAIIEGFVRHGVLSRRSKLLAVTGAGLGCGIGALLAPGLSLKLLAGLLFLVAVTYILTRPERV